jgi:hypothetical protein
MGGHYRYPVISHEIDAEKGWYMVVETKWLGF